MPVEFSRTTARKRITLGTSYVDVPVITAISFVDRSDRGQETQHSIDNSSNSARVTHVDIVYHTNPDTSQDTTKQLPVERIDIWKVIDPKDRYQETELTLDNVTGADSTPPSFTTHLKTHVVRYKNPDDPDNTWIDSELIDEFVVVDGSDRHQETHYYLNNPQTDDDAQADPNDPEISDSNNGIDPAWRTDPFQNIVNIAGFTPHRHRQFRHIYFTVAYSGPWPPYGYNGSFSYGSTTGTITADNDSALACTQAEGIITSEITKLSGNTVTETSSILAGPTGTSDHTFAFRVTWWAYVGDGYWNGSTTIPEAQYVTDADQDLWQWNGEGTWHTTDPGLPPPFN